MCCEIHVNSPTKVRFFGTSQRLGGGDFEMLLKEQDFSFIIKSEKKGIFKCYYMQLGIFRIELKMRREGF